MADAARCIIILLTLCGHLLNEMNSYSYAWLNNIFFSEEKNVLPFKCKQGLIFFVFHQ